jgi:uncharacterized RDD family membrane protein YckC
VTTERTRARALQGKRAGFFSRVVAAALDVSIVFGLLLLGLGGYAVVNYLFTSNPLEYPDPGVVWNSVAFSALLVAVLTLAWSGSGRTLGNAAVGLRVLTESWDRPTWRRALVRAVVVVYVPVIAMLWILVSRKNAGLHDLVCRTTVVYDWGARPVTQSRPSE